MNTTGIPADSDQSIDELSDTLDAFVANIQAHLNELANPQPPVDAQPKTPAETSKLEPLDRLIAMKLRRARRSEVHDDV